MQSKQRELFYYRSTSIPLLAFENPQASIFNLIRFFFATVANSIHKEEEIAKLEERDFIYRQPDKHDRRMVHIFLTPLGLEKKNRAKEVVIDFNKKLYGQIAEKDLDTFFTVLDSIHEILKSNNHASS